jgi:hypothetical protein
MKKIFLFRLKTSSFLFAFGISLFGFSQEQLNSDTSRFAIYRVSPAWKDMMDDTTANYFEVQKAFDLFWSNKELPLEEDEIIGEKRRFKNNIFNRTFNSKELKEQQLREYLAFHCKKYRWWLIKMRPYVQEDGSILPPHKKLEMWKKHYEELKEQTTE